MGWPHRARPVRLHFAPPLRPISPQLTLCSPHPIACDSGNRQNGESGVSILSSPDLLHWTPHGQVLSANGNGTWDQDTTNPTPFPLHSPSDPSPSILLAYRGCPYNCEGPELLSLAMAHK